MSDNSTEIIAAAQHGDVDSVGKLLDVHRSRLRRLVELRMDPRLAARVDPSDVVQETFAQAVLHLPEFLSHKERPIYVWLRGIACNRLIDLQRTHIMARRRTVLREQPWCSDGLADQSSDQLADIEIDLVRLQYSKNRQRSAEWVDLLRKATATAETEIADAEFRSQHMGQGHRLMWSNIVETLVDLSRAQLASGDLHAALATANKAILVAAPLVENNPEADRYRWMHLGALWCKGQVLWRLGERQMRIYQK